MQEESPEEIIVHCDYYDGVGVAIVCAPTGVFCTVQAGGTACEHPTVEGYAIDIEATVTSIFHEALSKFDDCTRGCWVSSLDEEKLNKYAQDIDSFLEKNISSFPEQDHCFYGNNKRLYFKFDYDRIKELMEGWWPVLIQFTNQNVFDKNEDKLYKTQFKGYLHFGNCD